MSEKKFSSFKGKPLVRSGDTLYYGFMSDPYVVKIDVKTKKKVGDIEIADKVGVQLMATDPTIPPQKMIEKTTEKTGLYTAIDIAEAWLSRKLTQSTDK